MREVYDFLHSVSLWFLATVENGQPRLRPFNSMHPYRDRLYFLTVRGKAVSRELHANPRVELCAVKDGRWLRVEGSAVLDDDRDARVSMLEAYPTLQAMYSPDDGNTEVWYLRNATATFYSFTDAPKTVSF